MASDGTPRHRKAKALEKELIIARIVRCVDVLTMPIVFTTRTSAAKMAAFLPILL